MTSVTEAEYRLGWHSWWSKELQAAIASGDEQRLDKHLDLDPPWRTDA